MTTWLILTPGSPRQMFVFCDDGAYWAIFWNRIQKIPIRLWSIGYEKLFVFPLLAGDGKWWWSAVVTKGSDNHGEVLRKGSGDEWKWQGRGGVRKGGVDDGKWWCSSWGCLRSFRSGKSIRRDRIGRSRTIWGSTRKSKSVPEWSTWSWNLPAIFQVWTT